MGESFHDYVWDKNVFYDYVKGQNRISRSQDIIFHDHVKKKCKFHDHVRANKNTKVLGIYSVI